MSKNLPRINPTPVVGITGGIGSGKSIAARFWEMLGIPCFYADKEAAALLDNNDEVKAEVTALLGQEAFQRNLPNRRWIARRVFQNDSLRAQLNAIIHPKVAERFESWRESHHKYPYLLKEAAIIFEIGQQAAYNRIALVSSPQALRMQRVMSRSGISAQEVKQRMAAQWSDAKKADLADYQIVNDEKQAIIPQIERIHMALLSEL